MQQLRKKLESCRRVLITGNGGIAMELVHEIANCQVVWVVREGHMGNAFFDPDAAQFLAPLLSARLAPAPPDPMAPPAPGGCTPSAQQDQAKKATGEAEPADPAAAAITGGGSHSVAFSKDGVGHVPEESDRAQGAAHVWEGAAEGAAEVAADAGRRGSRLAGSSLGPQWMHAALSFQYRPSEVLARLHLVPPWRREASAAVRPSWQGDWPVLVWLGMRLAASAMKMRPS